MILGIIIGVASTIIIELMFLAILSYGSGKAESDFEKNEEYE